ncbi:MAG: hypothetical protein ABF297_15440, partial [Thiogranum sp.]
ELPVAPRRYCTVRDLSPPEYILPAAVLAVAVLGQLGLCPLMADVETCAANPVLLHAGLRRST